MDDGYGSGSTATAEVAMDDEVARLNAATVALKAMGEEERSRALTHLTSRFGAAAPAAEVGAARRGRRAS